MVKKIISVAVFVTVFLCVVSCKDDVLPKPASHLRLDYAEAEYAHYETDCPFTFDVNSEGRVKQNDGCNLSINYPKMKATIYLTYKPVKNNIDSLLADAQKLTYKHVLKADDITEMPFLNAKNKVFGMFYQVNGNAATNTRFYVTDSTRHFIDCSVYFYAKPNFDSIMPATSYVRNDLQNLMESLRWK